MKAGATLTNFFSQTQSNSTFFGINSDSIDERWKTNNTDRQKEEQGSVSYINQNETTTPGTKGTSISGKVFRFDNTFVTQEKNRAQSPDYLKQESRRSPDLREAYYLPAGATKTGWLKTPKSNPTFLTTDETVASDRPQTQSRIFFENSVSSTRLQTQDFSLNGFGQEKPFIALPNLFREYEIYEDKRSKLPVVNPFTKKSEKRDLIASLQANFKKLEIQSKPKIPEDKRSSGVLSLSKKGSKGAWFVKSSSKPHQQPQQQPQQQQQQQPQLQSQQQQPSTKIQHPVLQVARITQANTLSSRITKGIQSFREMKQDKSDELNCNLNRLNYTREMKYRIRNKVLDSMLARSSKSDLKSIRNLSTVQEENLFKSFLPKDVRWYKELVSELSTHNYTLNGSIFILLDKIRYILERGNSLDKAKFVELISEIKPGHFNNLAFLYVLRKICKNIGVKKKELTFLFSEMKLYDVVALIQNSTLKKSEDFIA